MNVPMGRLQHRPMRIHLLGGLLTLTTVAALIGGAALLADPSGSLLGMPLADLQSSPFTDYFVPGMVLLALFGIVPLPILLGLWNERRWARVLAGLIGTGIATWSIAQAMWMGLTTPVQAIAFGVGLVLLGAAGAPVWRSTEA